MWWLIVLLGLLVTAYGYFVMKPDRLADSQFDKMESLLTSYTQIWTEENERVLLTVNEKQQDLLNKIRFLNERLRRIEAMLFTKEDAKGKRQQQVPAANAPLPSNHDPVVQLYLRGEKTEEIARRLGKGVGEVELAVAVYKQLKGDAG